MDHVKNANTVKDVVQSHKRIQKKRKNSITQQQFEDLIKAKRIEL